MLWKFKAEKTDLSLKSLNIWVRTPSEQLLWTLPNELFEVKKFWTPETQLWFQSALALWVELSTSSVPQSTNEVHSKLKLSKLSTLPHQNWSKPDLPSKS